MTVALQKDIEQPKTVKKILECAERLFATKGYDAASIRDITNEAGVNLASIHYYFGSKEKLLEELLKKKLDWLNQERLNALLRLESNADGAPLRPSLILDAFFGTLLKMIDDKKNGGEMFLKLLGRSSLEPSNLIWSVATNQHSDVIKRFKIALCKSLPGVPETEIVWRFHFMLGATTFAISGNGLPALFSNTDIKMENTSTGQKLLMNRLMTFLVGGLRAPLSKNMTTYESSSMEKN